MCVAGKGKQGFVSVFVDSAVIDIGIDPVAALGEDAAAIELKLDRRDAAALREGDGFDPAALVHDQTRTADAEISCDTVTFG